MTASNDLGNRLSDQFKQEAPQRAPDRVLLAALSTIDTTPQRHVRVPWRISEMNAVFRVAAIAAVALAIIFGPLNLLPRAVAPGASTNPSPTATTSPSAAKLPPTDCPAGTALPSGAIATIGGGGGFYTSTGDGGPALQATLSPSSFSPAMDAGGAFYFGDPIAHSVRRIGADGIISEFVGKSTGASLMAPEGIAFDSQGNLYIADPIAARIWKRDTTGTVTSVAGTGTPGSSGNEGPATEAQIQANALVIGPQGDIYFDDVNGVRRIDTNGVVHAFAGTGQAGYAGDNGPALNALFGKLAVPSAAVPDGSIYISDGANARLRMVDPSGKVTTVVGDGIVGFGGDGGPATAANLEGAGDEGFGPSFGVVIVPDGTVYVSDPSNNTIRRVDGTGTISTMAGVNEGHPLNAGFDGDCGSATSPKVRLNGPSGMVLHDGTLYFVDANNARIRIVVL